MAATAAEVDLEAAAVAQVGAGACPLHVVLECVVATSGGTVLACWQVVEGTDPVQLRAALRQALPAASARQVVQDQSILHTTLARLVKPPDAGEGDAAGAAALQSAVDAMTQQLCGTEAVLDVLWYAEEADKLALALGGAFSARSVPLQCVLNRGAGDAAAQQLLRR